MPNTNRWALSAVHTGNGHLIAGCACRPAVRPEVVVKGVTGRRVSVRLGEEAGSSFYRKPRGVASAVLYWYVGEKAPTDLSQWTYMGTSTTVKVELTLDNPALQPGAKIWPAAAWANPRGVRGAMSDPTYTYLQYGMIMPALLRAA